MKVFNCPVCRILPEITATEIKCPKCGKTAKGLNLPDTVKNWDEGNFATKTVVKPVAEEIPVDKSEDKPVDNVAETEKVVEKAPKAVKAAPKASKNSKSTKKPASAAKKSKK